MPTDAIYDARMRLRTALTVDEERNEMSEIKYSVIEIRSIDSYLPEDLGDHCSDASPGLTLQLRHTDEHGTIYLLTGTLSVQADDTLDIAILDEDGRTLSTEHLPEIDIEASQLMRDEWVRMSAEGHEVVV